MSEPVRIVIAYPDGDLDGALFRAVKRARRNAERSGYAARIELLPESAVPGEAAAVMRTDATRFQAEFDALVERLTASGRLVRGPEPPRTIAVHRGFRPLTSRARLAE